jgi:hypothetical protein
MRAHAASGGSFRIVFHPLAGAPGSGVDPIEEFEAVCQLVWLARDTVFVIDEVWRFCTSGSMPRPLENLAFTGRHRGVTLLWTAQRPARVAKDLVTIATSVHLFRVTRRDFDAIAYDLGAPEELAQTVITLPDRQRVVRDERMQWVRA